MATFAEALKKDIDRVAFIQEQEAKAARRRPRRTKG